MLRSVLKVQSFFLLFLNFFLFPKVFSTFCFSSTRFALRMQASIVSHFNNNILNSIIISIEL